jgi:hypothetical protein
MPAWAAEPAAPLDQQGVYVAVGYGGRRMMSRDGLSWEHVQQWAEKGGDDSNNLMSVAFGKGKFVCVGGGGFGKDNQAGHILVSADGQTWREVKKYPFRVNPVLFDGQRFIAGGPSRQLLWSEDGETWNEGQNVDLPKDIPSWAFWFRGGRSGGGVSLFYGNANKDQKTNWCLTTRDGKTIDHFAADMPSMRGSAFGNGLFVLATAQGLRTSADGKVWAKPDNTPDEELRWVVWTGKSFIAGGKTMLTSSDGKTWTDAGKAPGHTVVWADEKVMIGTGWPGNMYASTDGGKTWKKTGQPMPAMGVNHVVRGDKR